MRAVSAQTASSTSFSGGRGLRPLGRLDPARLAREAGQVQVERRRRARAARCSATEPVPTPCTAAGGLLTGQVDGVAGEEDRRPRALRRPPCARRGARARPASGSPDRSRGGRRTGPSATSWSPASAGLVERGERLARRPSARRPSSKLPVPMPASSPSISAAQVKRALVRRPLDLEHGVGDARAEPRELLLELGLVVDVGRERVLDPLARTPRTIGPWIALEAVLEVERAERGLDERREDVAVRRQPLELIGGTLPRARSRRRSPRSSCLPTTAQLARLTTYARIFVSCPSGKSGNARRAPVRSRARARCRRGTRAARTTARSSTQRRMREDALAAAPQERSIELEELATRALGLSYWAARCSRRPGRRSGCPARPRPRS